MKTLNTQQSQRYGSASGRAPQPTQLGPHVINQRPNAMAQNASPNGANQIDPYAPDYVAKYGSPDPWYHNLFPTSSSGGGGDDPHTPNPYLQQLTDSINNQIAQAKNAALGQKKDLLLGFGSQELARKILGNKDPFVNLISDNPDKSFSTLAKMNYGYRNDQKNTNQNLNANNLFYGGARNVALTQLGRGHLQDVFAATQDEQGQLSAIQNSLMDTIRNLQNQLIQAQMQYGQGQ